MISRSTFMRIAFIVVFLSAVAGTSMAQDDITPLVDKGRKALAAGKYQEALGFFQQVVQKIQAQVSQSFEKFMPDALNGWEADEIESQSWAGTTDEMTHNMTHIIREYTRKSDGVECTVNITNWPQMVQGIQQSMSVYRHMGQMMNSDPNTKVSFDESDGWTILKIVEVDDKTAQLTAIGEGLMINIEVDSDDMNIAEAYLSKIDLKGLGKTTRTSE